MTEFRGVLETDDGAVILFEWQGLAVLTESGTPQLLGSLTRSSYLKYLKKNLSRLS